MTPDTPDRPPATQPAAQQLRPHHYLTLNVYWFALSFLWNSMGPILLLILVTQLVPESQKGSWVGLITALGLIVAIAMQPAAGAWTDAHTTKFGRRRPYIVLGTLGDIAFLLVMVFARDYWVLLAGYLLLQASSNIAHGPYQAYIPDLVPRALRGAVSGVKQLIEIAGMIAAYLIVGELVGSGQMLAAFVLIILFLVVTMAVTALGVSEVPFAGDDADQAASAEVSVAGETTTTGKSILGQIFCSRDFFLWLLSRLLVLLGGNLVRNYALWFLEDVLKLPNPAAEVGRLLAFLTIAILVVAYPAGKLSDRWGRKPLVVVSALLSAVGAGILTTATTLPVVLASGAIIGAGIGVFLSVDWAWGADLVPPDDCGRFLGISNLATAGAGVLAGLGGLALDFFNARVPNEGYTVLYASAAACYVLGALVAATVRETRRKAVA